MTSDRHPRTLDAAWDQLYAVLKDEGVRYHAGMQPDGELRPMAHNMNYGVEVDEAVTTLQQSGRLTIQQVLAIARLVAWVARASRI